MRLHTTFRGLDRFESAKASSLLERCTGRLERLLDRPVTVRAVVEQDGGSGRRVLLSFFHRGKEVQAQHTDHDVQAAIHAACERIRTQLVKIHQRKSTGRHRFAEMV